MIPVSKPPCHDDDSICPKGKPGQKEFSDDAAEIYWYWRLCCNLEDHPEDVWYKRWRRILDGVAAEVHQKRQDKIKEELRQQREDILKRRNRNESY